MCLRTVRLTLRVDDESSAHSGESHTDQRDRESGHDLVSEVGRPGLVVEDRQLLDDEDVHRVPSGRCKMGRRESAKGKAGMASHTERIHDSRSKHSDVGHDGEEHVLLLVERSRVEGRVVAEQTEPLGRKGPLEELSERVREELDLDG